jgi:riboflavin kinase/FMN adenylyltransferase
MPREYLSPLDPPARLTSFRERWRLLRSMGLDGVWLLRFDAGLRGLDGEAFVQWLTNDLGIAAVVVGHDFRFGRDGRADGDFLCRRGAARGFRVEVIAPQLVDGVRVSSRAVRSALGSGDLKAAARMLGRAYTMIARVVHGQHLGRTLGFPTANLRIERRRAALAGIFAVRVCVGGVWRDGVASLGTRPTVGGTRPLLEAHIFDFDGDLYGQLLEVRFVAKLRDEQKFASLEAMVEQMHRDAADARRALTSCSGLTK